MAAKATSVLRRKSASVATITRLRLMALMPPFAPKNQARHG
ncbi:MAG: hypothetical protein ACK5N4_19275 [Parabacteroides gordonii]